MLSCTGEKKKKSLLCQWTHSYLSLIPISLLTKYLCLWESVKKWVVSLNLQMLLLPVRKSWRFKLGTSKFTFWKLSDCPKLLSERYILLHGSCFSNRSKQTKQITTNHIILAIIRSSRKLVVQKAWETEIKLEVMRSPLS